MIEGLAAEHQRGDRGYDSDAIVQQATAQGMQAHIPPRKNRIVQRTYDRDIYQLRHWVENAFLPLTQWRGIATRYAKRSTLTLPPKNVSLAM